MASNKNNRKKRKKIRKPPPANPAGPVAQLVEAAAKLHAARLYQRYSDQDFFLVQTEGLEAPAVAVLMGFGGETYGLNLFLGPRALEDYRGLCRGGGASGLRQTQGLHMLGYQISRSGELEPQTRDWLEDAGVRPARHRHLPDPMVLRPGRVPRQALIDAETALLLRVVKTILAAAADPAFCPRGADDKGRVLCLTSSGPDHDPAVEIGWAPASGHAVSEAPEAPEPPTAPLQAPFALAGLPSSGDTWLVGVLPFPGAIQGEERQPHLLIVLSQQTQLHYPRLLLETRPGDVMAALAEMMLGHGSDGGYDALAAPTPLPTGLPDRLIFEAPPLYAALSKVLAPLGVQCIDGSDDPATREMIDELESSLIDHLSGAEGLGDPGDVEYQIPPPDGLEGWKEVDGWFKELVYDGFDHDDRYWGRRALKRYFGPQADTDALFNEFNRLMIIDSYAMWFTLDYRSARNRPTLAEQWLEDDDLPEALRRLIRDAAASSPSLYRVEALDVPAGKITLADLFSGEVTIATDFALSASLEPGWVLTGRLVPAGDFHLFYALGPVLAGYEIAAALTLFQEQRIEPSPAFFHDQPHVLGWLWDELHRLRKTPPVLQNNDREALVFHEAVLRCPDRPALERWIAQHPAWGPDGEATDAWLQTRRGTSSGPTTPETSDPVGPDPQVHFFETQCETPGGFVTVLARLEIEGDRLTLTTNSRRRHEAAVAALAEVPGVELESFETSAPGDGPARPDGGDGMDPDGPLGFEQDSEGLDEALFEAARGYLAEYYRGWLDAPNPSLGNRSPRQAAREPKLRPKLAALVRAMPDPVNLGDGGTSLGAPRQMLLTELGLEQA